MASLKSLLVPSKSVEVDFPGYDGFKLNLNFLSRESLINIRKKSSKTVFKRNQPTEELDDKLFLKLYTAGCIKGWKGLTYDYLNKLAPVDIADKDPTEELEYSEENALDLMQASSEFDSFISSTVTELSNFTNTSTSS